MKWVKANNKISRLICSMNSELGSPIKKEQHTHVKKGHDDVELMYLLPTLKMILLVINPFVCNAPFPYPLKTSEGFLMFSGDRKGCIGSKWVKVTLWNLFNVVNNYIKLKNKSYLGPYQRFMIPVDTRRRFNVYKTYRRRIDVLYDVLDVETSSCVSWNRAFLFHDRCLIGSWTRPS